MPAARCTATRIAATPGHTFSSQAGRLEERRLSLWGRWAEKRGVELEGLAVVETQARASLLEPLLEQLGEESLPAHPRAEVRIIVAAVAHLVDAGHHVRRLEREALLEPGPEDVLHFPGKAEQRVRRGECPGALRGFEDRLKLRVGEKRNHRRHVHVHGYPRLAQALYRQKAAGGSAGARLHVARDLVVQRRDRERRPHQVLARHRRQDIDVSLDQSRLGDEGNGLIGFGTDFTLASRDPVLAFYRLVSIGIDADHEVGAAVAGFRQLLAEKVGRVGLRRKPGFEVDAGRQTEVAMAGTGEAVVADDAIGDEVARLGGDVVEPHRHPERFDVHDLELRVRLYRLAFDVHLARDRGIDEVKEAQLFAKTADKSHAMHRHIDTGPNYVTREFEPESL